LSQTKSLDLTDPTALGDLFVKAPPAFARLERRSRAAEKAYQKAHDELVKLRKPTKDTPLSPELGSFRQTDPARAALAAAILEAVPEHVKFDLHAAKIAYAPRSKSWKTA